MQDQAARLREMAAALRSEAMGQPVRRTSVIAVTSGKGGVGKTNVSVNLCLALQAAGKDVLLLDCDLGLANADILLGTVPPYHLGHLLQGETDVRRLIHTTRQGLRLIAGGSGMGELANLHPDQLRRFVDAVGQLNGECDVLVLDTGAGLSDTVQEFVMAADKVLVVTTPEPTSMTDAYATIKALSGRRPSIDVNLVINQAESDREGQAAAERICVTARDFLGLQVEHLGTVPRDGAVFRAVRQKTPFLLGEPRSAAAAAVREMAEKLTDGTPVAPAKSGPSGGGFFDRLAGLLGRRKSSA